MGIIVSTDVSELKTILSLYSDQPETVLGEVRTIVKLNISQSFYSSNISK